MTTNNKKIIKKEGKYFTESEKHSIIKELLSSKCTKVEIWEKYTGEVEEHGQLLRWMRKLGYHTSIKTRRPNFDSKSTIVSSNKKHEPPRLKKQKKSKEVLSDTFENLQLKKRISELENQLKDSEMKAIAFSTMVDIAEDMFKIPIRKKLTTKP